MGREGQGWTPPFSPWRGEASPIRQNKFLILFVDVCVKTLVELGRKYQWQRPERCPNVQFFSNETKSRNLVSRYFWPSSFAF